MGAPYSLDLREPVVAAVAAGMSCAQAAAHYQVSHSSAIRWTRCEKETGSPATFPMGGKKPFVLAQEADWIRTRISEKPDLPRHRPVQQHRRGHMVMPQRCHQRHRLPRAERHLADQPLTLRTSPATPGHLERQCRFIDEDQPLGIELVLPPLRVRGETNESLKWRASPPASWCAQAHHP